MDGLLAAAREVLGMELAYLAELRDTELVLREVDGEVAGYGGERPGARLPREHSWCHEMVAGDAPQLVRADVELPQAADAPFVTATGIRAYAGVPVRRLLKTHAARIAAVIRPETALPAAAMPAPAAPSPWSFISKR